MSDPRIPEGWGPARHAPYSQHIGPLVYTREKHPDGTQTGKVGVFLEPHHVGGNGRGHGGLLLTVLDEAMGMNAALARNKNPVVTVSMQTSFLGALEIGTFLWATAVVSRQTRGMAFMEGRAYCGDTLVGTANGVWKYLKMPTATDTPATAGFGLTPPPT